MTDKSIDLIEDIEPVDPVTPPPDSERIRQKKILLLKLALFFMVITFLSGSLFYLYVRFAPLPDSDLNSHSRILSADGSMLADLTDNGQNRVKVPISEIPVYLQQATVAIEDAQFYNHGGFNFRGIARALYVDLKNGEIVEGGSSITQQLAKVLFLSQDRTFSRKLQEVLLTIQLETRFSKQEILENYLNAVYYGNGANGVGAAAKLYFNKPVSQLTLAESSLLAGLPKGPSIYSPFDHLDQAKARQHQVLEAMVRNGYITGQQADEAYQQPLTLSSQKNIETGAAPYFSRYAAWSALNQNGVPEDELYRGGVTLQTTIDLSMQKAAEAAVRKYLPNTPGLQTALIALDPTTGEIKAMVGGRAFEQSTLNRVLSRRQPGSSFKPFVYLTALESGITPVKMYKSEQTSFPYDKDKVYTVKNFDNIYVHDYINMREAIKRSDNVYAVSTEMEVTPQRVIQTLDRFGFATQFQPYPSLALGVFPVSPLEMARAYAALANGGTLVEPTAIRQVTNAYGREIYHRERQTRQVASPQNAFILTDLMKSVFDVGGTAARIQPDVANRIVAGKTGTTDTDAWMAGYTPNLVCVVWVGYDKDQLLGPVESRAASQIWGDFIKNALANEPAADFPRPDGLLEVNIDPTTGMIATDNCPRVEREFFRIGTEPLQECTVHKGSPIRLDKTPDTRTESSIEKIWRWFKGSNER
ncbi:transglycosylase domain-containing protein [Effusibacillus dendaii]|uniref:Penicillin-binding protein 2D n=1 Tax=Effusibacillus dendaii TaxID=2743772 RepID=A0A7I8DGB7_9BACL|nr:PBP1A family penicillin-binding protein [Effusibacillus dendaii]BCJ87630.1 penicillin-binding protein 2D [Effusibacillus dendaii]